MAKTTDRPTCVACDHDLTFLHGLNPWYLCQRCGRADSVENVLYRLAHGPTVMAA